MPSGRSGYQGRNPCDALTAYSCRDSHGFGRPKRSRTIFPIKPNMGTSAIFDGHLASPRSRHSAGGAALAIASLAAARLPRSVVDEAGRRHVIDSGNRGAAQRQVAAFFLRGA